MGHGVHTDTHCLIRVQSVTHLFLSVVLLPLFMQFTLFTGVASHAPTVTP